MVRLPCFWLSSYVASQDLAMAPQSSAKDQFYCTVYYITLNPICATQSFFKILKKMWKIGFEAQINGQVI
jgi:hypothetical protein